MPTMKTDAPQSVKDLAHKLMRRKLHDRGEHLNLFRWNGNAYHVWALALESLRPVAVHFGRECDSIERYGDEPSEELRRSVMLEF